MRVHPLGPAVDDPERLEDPVAAGRGEVEDAQPGLERVRLRDGRGEGLVTARVVRGGDWTTNGFDLVAHGRLNVAPGSHYDIIGFRCAKPD